METYTVEVFPSVQKVIYFDWADAPQPIMLEVTSDSIDLLCADDYVLCIF